MRTKSLRIIVGSILWVVVGGCAPSTQGGYPLPAAHRADRAAGMDNSKVAIQSAVASEVPYIEVDVRPTGDEQFVLYHDSRFHRRYFAAPTAPEDALIESLSLALLRQQRFADGSGTILTFAEGLPLLRGSNSIALLDVKGVTEGRLTQLMQQVIAAGQEHNVIVQCQAPEAARFLATRYREIRFLARVHRPEQIAEYLSLRPSIVQLDPEIASHERINQIKATGALVLIKAVDSRYDSPDGWRELKRLGADIVLTDYPSALLPLAAGSRIERR